MNWIYSTKFLLKEKLERGNKMALEDSVKALENLQVGNVERVIEEVEKYKYHTNNKSDKTQDSLATYRALLEYKLPRAIDNLNLLTKQIFGVRGTFSFTNGLLQKGNEEMKASNREMDLEISDYLLRAAIREDEGTRRCFEDYTMNFRFNPKGSNFLKEISITHWGAPDKGFNRDARDITLVKPMKPAKFVQYLIDSIVSDLGNNRKSRFSEAPRIIIGIPNLIPQVYQYLAHIEDEKRKLIKSNGEEIEPLDVSDF